MQFWHFPSHAKTLKCFCLWHKLQGFYASISRVCLKSNMELTPEVRNFEKNEKEGGGDIVLPCLNSYLNKAKLTRMLFKCVWLSIKCNFDNCTLQLFGIGDRTIGLNPQLLKKKRKKIPLTVCVKMAHFWSRNVWGCFVIPPCWRGKHRCSADQWRPYRRGTLHGCIPYNLPMIYSAYIISTPVRGLSRVTIKLEHDFL